MLLQITCALLLSAAIVVAGPSGKEGLHADAKALRRVGSDMVVHGRAAVHESAAQVKATPALMRKQACTFSDTYAKAVRDNVFTDKIMSLYYNLMISTSKRICEVKDPRKLNLATMAQEQICNLKHTAEVLMNDPHTGRFGKLLHLVHPVIKRIPCPNPAQAIAAMTAAPASPAT